MKVLVRRHKRSMSRLATVVWFEASWWHFLYSSL
jgi:hypothetical protein